MVDRDEERNNTMRNEEKGMKNKIFLFLSVLMMFLNIALGISAQVDEDYFDETWSEETVLTIFSDMDLFFPDLFADDDSDYLWADPDTAPYLFRFPVYYDPNGNEQFIAKAPIREGIVLNEDGSHLKAAMSLKTDPCGEGIIKYDVTLTKATHEEADAAGFYYGDENVTHIRSIYAYTEVADPVTGDISFLRFDPISCKSTGGDDCRTVSFKRESDGVWRAHLKGELVNPHGVLVGTENLGIRMVIDYSDYATMLWPVDNTQGPLRDTGSYKPDNKESRVVEAEGVVQFTDKDYCQDSLQTYNAFNYESSTGVRAIYDENTGEARFQAVIRNLQPEDTKKKNYVIPADIWAIPTGSMIRIDPYDRITGYTCKYTLYNVPNAAPRTDYCKYGEGIYLPPHAMIRFDITIENLSGAVLREAAGNPIHFKFRVGGMNTFIQGTFEASDDPCPPETRLEVRNPLRPFVTFYYNKKVTNVIRPYNGIYRNGLWGIYQKCGRFAFMAVRIGNNGVKPEVLDLNRVDVSIAGGNPLKWNWVLTTVAPDKTNKITLEAGEEVILICRAKVTDTPFALNSDKALNGAVNFRDHDLYIAGSVFSDHNNTSCMPAP